MAGMGIGPRLGGRRGAWRRLLWLQSIAAMTVMLCEGRSGEHQGRKGAEKKQRFQAGLLSSSSINSPALRRCSSASPPVIAASMQ